MQTYTYPAGGWLFEWSGGPYIDVRRPGTVTSPEGWEVAPTPVHAINVWDYETDRATIDGPEGLRAKAAEWLEESAADYERNGY